MSLTVAPAPAYHSQHGHELDPSNPQLACTPSCPMAAHARVLSRSEVPTASPSFNVEKSSPLKARPSRPAGSCHFKDLSAGHHGQTCGCRRFWEDERIRQTTYGEYTLDPTIRALEWCMCGHHACFHDTDGEELNPQAGFNRLSSSPTNASPSRRRTAAPSQPSRASTRPSSQPCNNFEVPLIPQHCLLDSQELPALDMILEPNNNTYDCGLTPGHQGNNRVDRQPGLGLSMIAESTGENLQEGAPFNNQAPSKTATDQETIACASVCDQESFNRLASPDIRPGFPDESSFARRLLLAINEEDTGRGDATEDIVQSATEVITPSLRGTPDFRSLAGFDQHFNETRQLVGEIAKRLPDGSEKRAKLLQGGTPNIPPATTLRSALPTESRGPSSQSSRVVRQKEPDALPSRSDLLRQVVLPLHNLMNVLPNVTNTLRSQSNRIDRLENASFSHGPVEELNDRYETMDVRMLEVESGMDDLAKWRAALEEDNTSSGQAQLIRRRLGRERPMEAGTPSASFNSSSSLPSATSSAYIAAAIENAGTVSRLTEVESRLSGLEATSTPSPDRPWDIEVIFLPWGRELKSIWCSANDLGSSGAPGSATQLVEEWSQSQSLGGMPQEAAVAELDRRSGWDGAAIRRWAHATEEWFVPKACGLTNNTFGSARKVYERLKSRGLVRNVQVTGASSRDVQLAITRSYGSLLDKMCGGRRLQPSQDSVHDERELPSGLKSQFIPLRKLYKDSRLRFLNPDELVTSVLWTPEFLASSVMMNPRKGQKRLFITQRDAYLQYGRDECATWTWQKLEGLRPVGLNPSSTEDQATTTDPEGLGPKTCWEWDSRLDPRLSAPSSQASNSSSGLSSLSIRSRSRASSPHSQQRARSSRAPSPTSVSIQQHGGSSVNRPISPVSEFPLDPTSQRRRRTISVPVSEPVSEPAGPPSSKRRVASHGIPSPTKSLAKRRRISNTPNIDITARAPSWAAPTPKRSDSSSPFFDDLPSWKSSVLSSVPSSLPPGHVPGPEAGAGARRGYTPTAYATPYSGTIAYPKEGEDASGDDASNSSDSAKCEDSGDDDKEVADLGAQGVSDWEGVRDEKGQLVTGLQMRARGRGPRRHINPAGHSDGEGDGMSE